MKIGDYIRQLSGSLRAKTGLAIILTAALLMQLIGAMQYYYAREEIRSDLGRQAERGLVIKAKDIKGTLNTVEVALKNRGWEAEQALASPELFFDFTRRMVEDNPDITGFGIAFVPDYFPQMGKLFEPYSVRRTNGTIETLQVASDSHDYTTSALFIASLKADSTYWCDPYMDADGAGMMLTTYVCPLHDAQGRTAGMMQVDVSVDWLGRTLNERKLYPSSFDLLLTSEGTLIGGPDNESVSRQTMKEIAALISDSTLTRTYNESGRIKILSFKDKATKKDGYIFYATLGHESQWQLAEVNYKEEIFANLTTMRNRVLCLMAAGLLLLGFIIHRAARSMSHLQEANLEKERISSELKVASKIQLDMLPKVFPPFPERKDIDLYGKLVSAKEVDGDLYDFFIRDEKLFFCIGDVSGKGVPAALVMAVVHSLFRNIAAHQTNPSSIVQHINEYCCQSNDSGMFVTFFLGVIDLPTGRLRYCNAGHDHPVIVGKEGIRMLPAKSNLPLAVMDYTYTTQEEQLEAGDAIFLYTDGLTEAKNASRQQFRLKRVMEVLENCLQQQRTAPKQLIDDVIMKVNDFVQDAQQSDDLTLLAMQYTPQEEHVLLEQSITLQNDVKQVKQLNTFVKTVHEELLLGKSLSMKLMLGVEEAVVNVMDYAYPGSIKGEVTLQVVATAERLKYIITDKGIAFAPTEVSKADTTLSVEDRPIGGLGIFLVRNLMDSINYERINGTNVLTMWKKVIINKK